MKSTNNISKMVTAAFFLALTYVMPFLTGQIPEIGSMLCPMHIPVIICGFICGANRGLSIGLIAPILRSLTLGMPPFFPNAVCMAFELAVYGYSSGILYKKFQRKKTGIYLTLIISMLLGRIAWGLAMIVTMGLSGGTFTFSAFVAGAITNALPGIIIQIILIPLIVAAVESMKKRRG